MPSAASNLSLNTSTAKIELETPPNCLTAASPTKPKCAFQRCLHPAACLGNKNDEFELRYWEGKNYFEETRPNTRRVVNTEAIFPEPLGDPVDLALYSHWREICDEDRGYANNCTDEHGNLVRCRLCGECKSGYVHDSGGTTKCKRCPEIVANRFFLAMGAVVMVVGSAVLIYTTIESTRQEKNLTTDGIQKCIVNFLQLSSLATGLPLQWPEPIEDMFAWFTVISSAGSNLLTPDCELSEEIASDVYFGKQIAFASLPPIVIVVCFFVWAVIGACSVMPVAKRLTRRRIKKRDVKTFTVLSSVLIVFLAYSFLTRNIFSMLKCPTVGHQQLRYLVADLQEPCYEGRHLHYLLALTIPQILVYVVGLPAAAVIVLRRNSDRIERRDESFRISYGVLYIGYRQERSWWEAVIAGRKVIIILVGTFGTRDESVHMQA